MACECPLPVAAMAVWFWPCAITTKESSNHVLIADQHAGICMNVMGGSYRIAHRPQSIDICHEGGFLKKIVIFCQSS
jgi:hypothetical protein